MTKSEDNLDMHILKKATCKSITGKSTLGYEIACTQDNSIHIRISKNTGAGFFNVTVHSKTTLPDYISVC